MKGSSAIALLAACGASTATAQIAAPPAPPAPPIYTAPPPPPPPYGLKVEKQANGAKLHPRREPVSRERRTADVSLSVTPGGQVVSCRVVRGSGSAALDDASCAFARESRLAGWQAGPSQSLCCAPGEVRWSGRNAELVMWHAALAPRVLNPGAVQYPAAALKAGQQGTTRYAIDVDAAGRVTDCRIAETSGHPALDEATCAFLRTQARVQPGRDRYGKSTREELQGRVMWRLGD